VATGRIGVTPTLGVRWSKAPTGGTTSLSGLDDNSVSLVYSVGYEQVYRNGVLLSRTNDYTATTGNSITLIDATITGDIIEVFANELVPLTDAISKGQFTAKGALLSATAASTPGVLTVGSNDQVLTADSSTATGLKWATAGGIDPFLTPEVAGYYVKRAQTGTADNNTIIPITTTFYFPVFLPTASYDRISMRSGAFVGTATVRMGLYNASSTTGLPTTVVFDAGTVSPSVINTNYEITISQSLTAGYYYMAINLQAKTGDGDYITGGALPTPGLPFLTTATSFGTGVGFNYFTQSGVSGAFATAGSLTASNSASCPIVGMRIA